MPVLQPERGRGHRFRHVPLAALGCRLAGWAAASASGAAALAEVAPAVGSAARGPEAGGYIGICLGNCFDCHSLLESLPRWPRLISATSHTDPTRASVEELEAFLKAPEVCDVERLYPLSLDREIWSLVALDGGPARLRFHGARAQVRAAAEQCTLLHGLAGEAFAEARRSASACVHGMPGDGGSRCRTEASRRAAASYLGRMQAALGRPAAWRPPSSAEEDVAGAGDGVVDIDFAGGGNETRYFLEAIARRAELALLHHAGALWMPSPGGRPHSDAGVEASTVTELALGEGAATALLDLALQLGRSARLLMEHVRTIWGVKDLTVELSSVYPDIQERLPVLRFHPWLYGRHWDVLEWLLHNLAGGRGSSEEEATASDPPLRMVELGVACGPIGIHLLPRFPSLKYFGADPTVPADVFAAYSLYKDRATVFAKTSEELHSMLDPAEAVDFVFIDGPHTYRNVRNDLELWVPRIRPGGIVAGHDFTCHHPPLLWAVTEYRMQMGGAELNLAMDGVWWWQVN